MTVACALATTLRSESHVVDRVTSNSLRKSVLPPPLVGGGAVHVCLCNRALRAALAKTSPWLFCPDQFGAADSRPRFFLLQSCDSDCRRKPCEAQRARKVVMFTLI